MSDKDNDNDRYKDGVIKHPDVIKKEMEQEKAELEKAAKKAAAEAKLAALGLTTDDLKALGL